MNADSLLSLVMTQAWQIALLTLAVLCFAHAAGNSRPQLIHAMWLLVVIKCVTPPVWAHHLAAFSQLQSFWASRELVPDPTEAASGTPRHSMSPRAVSNVETDAQPHGIPPAPDPLMSSSGEWHADDRVAAAGRKAPTPGRAMADDFIESPVTNASVPFTAAGERSDWSTIVLWSLMCGAALNFAVLGVRCIRCIRMIWRHRTTRYDGFIQRQVAALAQRLKLRRIPRVIVSDVHFGPAVLGFWRPAIVVPSCLLDDALARHAFVCSSSAGRSGGEETGQRQSRLESFLSPVLGHELLHIKRGDLKIGALQALVHCLWWFHPVVWMVNRWLTREAERCCDDQVIAELQCSPAVYARSLLAVIESKHPLKPVPVFPGMKHVEITAARMERIMSLKNGIERRSSFGSRLLLLTIAVLMLPGGTLPATQSVSSDLVRTINATAEGSSRSTGIASRPDADDHHNLTIRIYDVGDVTERMKTDMRLSEDDAVQRLQSLVEQMAAVREQPLLGDSGVLPPAVLPSQSPSTEDFSGTASTVRARPNAPDNAVGQPAVACVGGKLVVCTTPAGHSNINEALVRYGQFGFRHVRIEAQFISGAPAVIEQLAGGWTNLISGEQLNAFEGADLELALQPRRASPNISPVGHITETVQRHVPLKMKRVDGPSAQKFIRRAQESPGVRLLSAPTIVVFNGQCGQVRSVTMRPFVVSIRDDQPVVRTVREGLSMSLIPELMDTGEIQLNCIMTQEDVTNVTKESVTLDSQQTVADIQIPEVTSQRFRATIRTPAGQSVILGGLQNAHSGERESVYVLLSAREVDAVASAPTLRAAVSKADTITARPIEQGVRTLPPLRLSSNPARILISDHLDGRPILVFGARSESRFVELVGLKSDVSLRLLLQSVQTVPEHSRLLVRMIGPENERGNHWVRDVVLEGDHWQSVAEQYDVAPGSYVSVAVDQGNGEPANHDEALSAVAVGLAEKLDHAKANIAAVQVRQSLDRVVSWNFSNVSLVSALRSSAATHGANIALTGLNAEPDRQLGETSITSRVSDLPLKHALTLLLVPRGWQWVSEHGAVLISRCKVRGTPEFAVANIDLAGMSSLDPSRIEVLLNAVGDAVDRDRVLTELGPSHTHSLGHQITVLLNACRPTDKENANQPLMRIIYDGDRELLTVFHHAAGVQGVQKFVEAVRSLSSPDVGSSSARTRTDPGITSDQVLETRVYYVSDVVVPFGDALADETPPVDTPPAETPPVGAPGHPAHTSAAARDTPTTAKSEGRRTESAEGTGSGALSDAQRAALAQIDERQAELVQLIRSSVDSASWDDDTGGIAFDAKTLSLIIRQTGENHDHISTLLTDLRQALVKQVRLECRVVSLDSPASIHWLEERLNGAAWRLFTPEMASEVLLELANRGERTLIAPRVMVADNQQASVKLSSDPELHSLSLLVRPRVLTESGLLQLKYAVRVGGNQGEDDAERVSAAGLAPTHSAWVRSQQTLALVTNREGAVEKRPVLVLITAEIIREAVATAREADAAVPAALGE